MAKNIFIDPSKPTLRVAGLMSGTSVDGVDVAIIDYTWVAQPKQSVAVVSSPVLQILAFETFSYSAALRKSILKLFNPETARIEDICHLNFAIGEVFAEAVIKLCKKHKIPLSSIDLIGSHGQTIWHSPNGRVAWPEAKRGHVAPRIRSTLQIGEPCVIAQRTGITTVADFRTADIAAGGQGAPLVPFVDHILFADKHKNRIVQNIGGIANLTWLPANGSVDDIIAFDTGPGNMMIDCLISILSKGKQLFDKNGIVAATGKVNELLLCNLMQHRFLKKKPPKTTGREEFGHQFTTQFLQLCGKKYLIADMVATVTAFTAKSIADAYKRFLPDRVDEVILCGGGSRNPTLIKMLKKYVAPAKMVVMDDLGINADAKEAISFAILAAHTIKGIPSNAPAATGAKKAVVLGKIIPPQPL
ncbi:MAG: anhydro-N-acetylmuramic acid kinase [Sedimentisphaerales bacterium]|nr:anhydro-N-acetylmuramic acid kinase [Sedimentisphaerales bacterium]